MTSEVSQVLETLRHHFRREIVDYFEKRPERSEATIAELVNHIGEGRSAAERQQVEMSLFHTHLPKLATTDWLDFDREERIVRYHGRDEAESASNDAETILE